MEPKKNLLPGCFQVWQSQIKFACSNPGLIAQNSFLAHDLAPCFEWLDLGLIPEISEPKLFYISLLSTLTLSRLTTIHLGLSENSVPRSIHWLITILRIKKQCYGLVEIPNLNG